MLMPPTSFPRSRPPSPMAWLIPRPRFETMQLTSWIPVPAAPTMPTGPRFTTLAKPSATPPMIAVPQSGPITMRPSRSAFRFRATSSSIGTLSLKIITCIPRSSAASASRRA